MPKPKVSVEPMPDNPKKDKENGKWQVVVYDLDESRTEPQRQHEGNISYAEAMEIADGLKGEIIK